MKEGRGGGVGIVLFNSPRPQRRRHPACDPGGKSVPAPIETSGRLLQHDNEEAERDSEGRTYHRGGSDVVSCAGDDWRQEPFSADELQDRLVELCDSWLVLGGCELPLPRGGGIPSRGNPKV